MMKTTLMAFAVCLIAVCAMFVIACPPSPVAPLPDASDAACGETPPEGSKCPPCPSCAHDAGLPKADVLTPVPLCDEACANLRAVGCAEGIGFSGSPCEYALCAASEAGLIDFHLACLAAKKTKAEIRACAVSGQTKKPLVACP